MSEASGFFSARSSSQVSTPASDGSTSVCSSELDHLLASLRIGQRTARRVAPSDEEGSTPTSRPACSGLPAECGPPASGPPGARQQEAGSSSPAGRGSLKPRRPCAGPAPAGAAAATAPEVIDLLSSSPSCASSSGEEWSPARPSTVQRRRQVIESSSSDSEGGGAGPTGLGSPGAAGSSSDDELSPPPLSRRLPPYFVTIHALQSVQLNATFAPPRQLGAKAAAAAAGAPAPPGEGAPRAAVPKAAAKGTRTGAAAPAAEVPAPPGGAAPKAAVPKAAAGGARAAAAAAAAAGAAPRGGAARARPARGGGVSQPAAAFKRQREGLARQLFEEFNAKVFGGRLPADLEIRWNNRLSTTAGLTHYRREPPAQPFDPPRYSAHVELSSKVLDALPKLERTLCHELCHVAAWLLDHTAKPPHGPVFRKWADRAMAALAHLDVTTCHSYEIFYAFRWRCSNASCGQTYGRHSNSIDVNKKVCGDCKSRLVFLGKFQQDGSPAKPARAPNAYSRFVQEQFGSVKAEAPPGTPHSDIMKRLSQRWAARQQQQPSQQQQQQQNAGPAAAGAVAGAGGGDEQLGGGSNLISLLEGLQV